jgi:membrane protease YdiL (CAAX protease family)
MHRAGRTTAIALLFEGGLGAMALGIGWLAGQWPLVGIRFGREYGASQIAAIGWGLVATAPLLVALLFADRLPCAPLQRLSDLTASVVRQMFGGASLWQLAAVALAAGIGEELFFRGLIQAGLARFFAAWPGIGSAAGGWMGYGMALAVASVLFGICHWLTTTYAVLAMLVGVYFGLLLMMTGSLWTPLIAHAAYDFLALAYLTRADRLLLPSVE